MTRYAYSFPIAAVRNDYRLTDLNNTDVLAYSSRSQKSSTSQQGSIPSGGSRGESVPLLFLASRGCLHSLAHGQHHSHLYFSHHISFSASDHPPLSSKGPCDSIEATQIIEGYLTISGPLT